MRHMVPAYEFRRRAREAMKPVLPILLVVALIAALPSLINDTVTLLADADPSSLMTDFSNRLLQVMENAGLTQSEIVGEAAVDEAQLALDVLAVQEEYLDNVMTFVQEKGLLVAGLTVMVLVISPVLTLGMINALLHALRKKEFTASIALSRGKYLLKALGLELFVALKLLLWMLPGMALALVSLFLPETLALLAMLAGMIAMIVMGVMAGYRYAMAVFVLADEPATRIRDCVRRSCEVMKHRKFELFSLEISFIGWNLLLSLAQSMLLSLGAVLGMALGMFASLFLTVYTNCAQAAFYQEYALGPVEAAPAQDPAGEELV